MRIVFFACLFILCLLFIPKSIYAYSTNMSASVVIGQKDFASYDSVGAAITLNSPSGIASDGSHLVITDTSYHRVLVFNKTPTTNNAAPDVVIGQQNMQSTSANQGLGVSRGNTLNTPTSAIFAQGKLLIADTGNNRVLVYNKVPTSSNAYADVVIGQSDLNSRSGSCSATRMDTPYGIDWDSVSGKLAISDSSNYRVLIYDSIPTTNGAAANVAIGNYSGFNCSGFVDLVNEIDDVEFTQGKLFIVDRTYHRVLGFLSIPTTNRNTADFFIGQVNSSGTSANQGGSPSANTLSSPSHIASDGKRLFIFDYNNSRILIFNSIPTSSNASADLVLGQQNFSSNSEWQGADDLTAFELGKSSNSSGDIFVLDNKLYASDYRNSRVLIFNNIEEVANISLENRVRAGSGGKERIYGRATQSTYNLTGVECSVNNSGFFGATAVDGFFNSLNENFYCEFSRNSGNSSGKEGYTLKVRSRNVNLDEGVDTFYFDPFTIVTPTNGSTASTNLPTFKFKVNTQRIQIRDNVAKYQVQISKANINDFKVYIDNIPVDFESVRQSKDNIQRNRFRNTTNNGIYENTFFKATYQDDSSNIEITAKDTKDHIYPLGRKLTAGEYKVKVVAIDRSGHTQETTTNTFKVTSNTNTTSQQTNQSSSSTNSVLGTRTTDPTGHPLPTPAPSPEAKVQTNDDNKKFCVWFVCF